MGMGTGNGEPVVTVTTHEPSINGTLGITPSGQPNVRFKYVNPIIGLVSLVAYTFVDSILAVLGVGSATNLMPAGDFYYHMKVAASLAVATAGMAGLRRLGVILYKVSKEYEDA